ncbi:MAG: hypothetical protein U9M92_02080 [Patescibacteria group bacterium]|nr:hypothetical protein [Patescibacteria group bacterium]
MTSPDGITWTARATAEVNFWYSVTYGNGTFVATAGSGTNRVMTSGKADLYDNPHDNIYQGGMSIMGGNVGMGTTTDIPRGSTSW